MREGATGSVLLVTIRGLNPHAAWCSNYEFEDVIRQVDDVDVSSSRRLGTRRCGSGSRAAWPGGWDLDALQPRRQTGPPRARLRLARVRVHERLGPALPERHSGLAGALQDEGLLHGRVLRRARPAARSAAARLSEFDWSPSPSPAAWPPSARLAGEALSPRAPGRRRPALHAPPGRRRPRHRRAQHRTSLRAGPPGAASRIDAAAGLYYVHDTLPGALVRPSSPAEHREMLASSARRSRFFVTYPAKFGDERERRASRRSGRATSRARPPARSSSDRPRGARPSGTTSPGRTPSSRPGPTAATSGTSSRAPRSPGRDGERSRFATPSHALRRHDWGHRWRALLDSRACRRAPR